MSVAAVSAPQAGRLALHARLFLLALLVMVVGPGCDLDAGQRQAMKKAEAEMERRLERAKAQAREQKRQAQQSPSSSGVAGAGAIAPMPATPPAGAPGSFADLARQADAAVVFVRTITERRRGFQRYLGEGSGSGFVFDGEGKILTNYHVVRGARAIVVEFADGTSRKARIIGADPLTDVAVLGVTSKRALPALALGDSDRIRVGDWVVAIGNPFGLEHTVSAGIISAKERTSRDVNVGNASSYYSFLQTDASINPGNSGGPLLDLSGKVVGMNTAINPEANSIGFAIPVNMIRELIPRLLEHGIVKRAALGVAVADVRQSDRDKLRLPNRDGALIVQVQQGGPADRAGFQPLDVVVELESKPIRSPEQLRWRTSLSPVNEPIEVVVVRDGKRLVLKPTLVPLSQ